MPSSPLFPNAYPRGGQIAILCEGDAVGYEAKLLKQWGDTVRPGNKAIDVWPCGTGHGVRGMADAIGRTVPICAILDRDFHDDTAIASIGKGWDRDAKKLGWSWLGVTFWKRNEIENYFLDDDVIQPVMTTAFRCTPEQVTQAVDSAVRLLVPFQSLQAAFQETRIVWEQSDPTSLLAPCHPSWGAAGLQAINPEQVRTELEKCVAKWRASLIKQDNGKNELTEPWRGDAFIAAFDRRRKEWSTLTSASTDWRRVWAGKEVLKLVRQQLCAAKPGWWSCDAQKQQPVMWHTMKNNAERNKHDREIERALLPEFVNCIVDRIISSDASDPRRAEFDEIAAILSQ